MKNNYNRFHYPLPSNVIPGGKHYLLVDPTDRYFGINLQKNVEFKRQTLIKSSRTKHLEDKKNLMIKNKNLLASKYQDKEARREAALAILKEMNEEEAENKKRRTSENQERKEKSSEEEEVEEEGKREINEDSE